MLNKIIFSFLLLFAYIKHSLQTSINHNTNTINYSYYDNNCEFIVYPKFDEDTLKNEIGKCENAIKDIFNQYEGKEINFHGKIRISSSVFDLLNKNEYIDDVTENILSQISILMYNFHNTIFLWDIVDDLITNEYVIQWIEKMNKDNDGDDNNNGRSPIILNDENTFITPYFELLKELFTLGNSTDKHVQITYNHSINLDTFNYNTDIEKLSIIHQIANRLQSELIPIQTLQFQLLFDDTKAKENVEKVDKLIYQFISKVQMFSNLNTEFIFLIPNYDNIKSIDFSRYIQKCRKMLNHCLFSLEETIEHYNPEITYKLNDINSKIMSSYFSPNLNIITTQLHKRDIISDFYEITYTPKVGSPISKIFEYDSKFYKFNKYLNLTYYDLDYNEEGDEKEKKM